MYIYICKIKDKNDKKTKDTTNLASLHLSFPMLVYNCPLAFAKNHGRKNTNFFWRICG
jgi:hypothetical protein